MEREKRKPYPWNTDVVTQRWFEEGTDTVDMDTIYQAFKQRLMAELCAEEITTFTKAKDGEKVEIVKHLPLRERA